MNFGSRLLVAFCVFVPSTALPTAAEAARPGDTIVEIALENESFSTLVKAVEKAGLVDTLNGKRIFTVFAPTNEAFDEAAAAVLGEGKFGTDLVDAIEPDVLRKILLYHVTPGQRVSRSVLNASRMRMAAGGFVFVEGTTLRGNSSSADLVVDLIDIRASNGIIHVIDFVLLP